MHPELRLIEDFMTDRGMLSLPALPRMFYVVRGAITVGRRTRPAGEVLYSDETVTAHAEELGRDAVALGAVRPAPGRGAGETARA